MVSTETDVVVVSETVTASTETEVLFATKTILATATATDIDIVTATPVLNFKKRRPTLSASPELPAYASQCPAWSNYVSACSCAGVPPITVTAAAPTTTVTVDATATGTVVSTETVLDDVTATALVSQTTVESVTVTTLLTQTTVLAETATTATVTQTQTTTPLVTSNVGYFQATVSPSNEDTAYLFANTYQLDQTTGYLSWSASPNGLGQSALWAYNWIIDDLGRLVMADVRPGGINTDAWAAYYATEVGQRLVQDSIGVSLASISALEGEIQPGATEGWVYAAVNATTNELILNAGGRTNTLYCGGYLYVSSGSGEELQENCVAVQPIISGASEAH